MPANSGSFPRFSGFTSTAMAQVCASASTMITPGHDRPTGKMPLEEPLVFADELAGDRAHTGIELEHLVDEEKRVAMGDDRLDDVASERRANDVCDLTGRRSHDRPSVLGEQAAEAKP